MILFTFSAFVMDFQGNFNEVLDLAEEFKKYAPKDGTVRELDEHAAHIFLEKLGETETVRALRDHLRSIDIDFNKKVAFIEYLLYKYKKNLKDLLYPTGKASPEALAALEKAIEMYQKVLAERAAREKKMADLEKIASAGGVKGLAAKNELEQMRAADQLEQNRKEITAAASKRKAEKAAKGDDGAREAALKVEQARVAEEKRKKEEEELRQRQASRDRLKAKANLFGQ
jgi:hypothetical protein